MSLVPDETVEHKPEGYPDGDEVWVIIPVSVRVMETMPVSYVKERLGEVAYDMAILQMAEDAEQEEEQDGSE